MDNQLRKLNTNVSGIARAMEEAAAVPAARAVNSVEQNPSLRRWVTSWRYWTRRRRMARGVPPFWLPSFVLGRKQLTKKSRRSAS
jgi:hypothetical protein